MRGHLAPTDMRRLATVGQAVATDIVRHAEAETSSNHRSNCENLTNELASFGCGSVHNELIGLEEADAFYRA